MGKYKRQGAPATERGEKKNLQNSTAFILHFQVSRGSSGEAGAASTNSAVTVGCPGVKDVLSLSLSLSLSKGWLSRSAGNHQPDQELVFWCRPRVLASGQSITCPRAGTLQKPKPISQPSHTAGRVLGDSETKEINEIDLPYVATFLNKY